MNEAVVNKIRNYCKELKLGTNIVRSIGTIQADSHEEFLAKVLEIEIKHREATRKIDTLNRQDSMSLRPLKTTNLSILKYQLV